MKQHKSKIIMTVIFFALNSLVFGQEKWNEFRGRRGKALEYKEVTDKELEKDIRVIKFSHKGKTSIDFSSVVVSKKKLPDDRKMDDEVKFFQENNLIHKIKLGPKNRVKRISDQGKYVIITTVIKESVIEEHDGLYQYELINANGKRMWTKTKKEQSDAYSNAYIISDYDGSVVEIDGLEGLLIFCKPNGEKIKSVDIFQTSEWDPSKRDYVCKFSNNGKYFAVGITDYNKEIFPNKSGIILFDNLGNELWKFPGEETMCYTIHISPDNRFIMSYHRNDYNRDKEQKNTMYLLNINGKLIKKYPNTIAGVLFSSDGEYVALNEGISLKLISTEDGEVLATYGLSHHNTRKEGNRYIIDLENRTIRGMDISSEKKMIAILEAKRKRIENVVITVYHFNCVPAWKKVFTDEKFKGYRLSIHISNDGEEVMTQLGRKIKKYKLTQ